MSIRRKIRRNALRNQATLLGVSPSGYLRRHWHDTPEIPQNPSAQPLK